MADVRNTVCLHLVWATWDRFPWLTTTRRAAVYDEIVSQAARCDCPVIAIGGVEDHVHVLVQFATTISIAELVKQMKGASSRRANVAESPDADRAVFRWQGGYGVFPVEPESVDRVAGYVRQQVQHHRDGTLDAQYEATGHPGTPSTRTGSPAREGGL